MKGVQETTPKSVTNDQHTAGVATLVDVKCDYAQNPSMSIFADDRHALEQRSASQRVSFLIPAARYPCELYLIKLLRQTQNHPPKVVLALNNPSSIVIFQDDSHLVVVGSYPKQTIASFGSKFQGAKHGELFSSLDRQPNICFRESGHDCTISTGLLVASRTSPMPVMPRCLSKEASTRKVCQAGRSVAVPYMSSCCGRALASAHLSRNRYAL